MDLGITNRVALVTGAGSGIGAATAELLGREGARVVLVDIHHDSAEAQAAKLAALDIQAMAIPADVTDVNSVAAAVDAANARFGQVDILVNNAGFTRDSRITRMELSDWDAVIDVILKGAFLFTKALLPGMIGNNWGRVINVSSRAHLGNAGQANYSAAKAGIIGFTRAMSLENGKYSITVNAVAPGIIDTAAVRALPHYEKVRENAEKSLPLLRLGEVDDVAAAIVFLSSERASYITGEVLHVTGGRYG